MQVASYLIDDEGTLVAARRLAAAIRAPLRATLRLLRTLPAVRVPACAPSADPPYTSLRDVIAALASLSNDQVANVLLHLHPLELIHLSKPLLHAGLARYATPSTTHPLDLRDPLFLHQALPAASMALPLWRAHCDHLLDIVSSLDNLPLAALKLSYTGAITCNTLSKIAGTLRNLQIFSPPLPAHISFLGTATNLTELSLVSACPPEGSLLAALASLPLKALEVVLPQLSAHDSALLCEHFDAGDVAPCANGSLAGPSRGASISASARRSLPPGLGAALARLEHAHLRTFCCDAGGPAPPWPPLLARVLPISNLQTFTCHPYSLHSCGAFGGSPSPLVLSAHAALTLRATTISLCWPQGWQRWGDRSHASTRERVAVSGADAQDVFTAAAAAMPHLRSAALDCRACSAEHLEALLQLSHLETLRLEGLQLSVAAAAAKWLQMLPCMRDLRLGLLPTAAPAPGTDDAGRNRVYRTLVEDLRLWSMPLTRLSFAEIPVTAATCGAIGSPSTLCSLEWSVTDGTADAALQSSSVAAFAHMLRSCSTLTSLRLPFWPRPADAGPLVAALVCLRELRELSVVFRAPAEPPDTAASPVSSEERAGTGGSSAGAPATPVCLLALEHLHVHLTGGDRGHLVQFVELLNLQAPKLEALRLQCDVDAEDVQPHALVRTIQSMPLLHTLHMPGGCMQAAEDVAVIAPAISRLPRLQELVFWGSVGVVGEAWRSVVKLPLGRGVVEFALHGDD